jgi:hypothetical protein
MVLLDLNYTPPKEEDNENIPEEGNGNIPEDPVILEDSLVSP